MLAIVVLPNFEQLLLFSLACLSSSSPAFFTFFFYFTICTLCPVSTLLCVSCNHQCTTGHYSYAHWTKLQCQEFSINDYLITVTWGIVSARLALLLMLAFDSYLIKYRLSSMAFDFVLLVDVFRFCLTYSAGNRCHFMTPIKRHQVFGLGKKLKWNNVYKFDEWQVYLPSEGLQADRKSLFFSWACASCSHLTSDPKNTVSCSKWVGDSLMSINCTWWDFF